VCRDRRNLPKRRKRKEKEKNELKAISVEVNAILQNFNKPQEHHAESPRSFTHTHSILFQLILQMIQHGFKKP